MEITLANFVSVFFVAISVVVLVSDGVKDRMQGIQKLTSF